MLKGVTTSFEVVLTRDLEVLAILMRGGGATSFHPLKGGGGANSFTLSWVGGGGGTQSFGPAVFPFLATLPIINDQSLRNSEEAVWRSEYAQMRHTDLGPKVRGQYDGIYIVGGARLIRTTILMLIPSKRVNSVNIHTHLGVLSTIDRNIRP